MNDRTVSLLENYDIEVEKTRKGRGAIICETRQGEYVLKEYTGILTKLDFLFYFLQQLSGRLDGSFLWTEKLIKTKEEALYVTDYEGTHYILKTSVSGRECNIKELKELKKAVETLAYLHQNTTVCEGEMEIPAMAQVGKEYEKHNKEIKRVKNFLKKKSQKTEFERFLMQNVDVFYEQGERVASEWNSYKFKDDICENGMNEDVSDIENRKKEYTVCHGDYQYHNVLYTDTSVGVSSFEKCILDDPVRDLSFFMRKILEKNNWSPFLGEELLNVYNKHRTLSVYSLADLYYRFAYPEKFWKIANYYFNNSKSWIPEKNIEKLKKVVEQETQKQAFLDAIFGKLC